MPITEIKNKDKWPKNTEFLQSWEYGQFLQSAGRKVLHLQGPAGHSWQCLIFSLPLKHKFAYIPRAEISKADLSILCQYFKKQNFLFVRLETLHKVGECRYKKKSVKNRQPHFTWLLDVTKETDKILQEMHSKTRYNIRLAQKKGVIIKSEKDLEVFWRLNTITTQRNKYQSHPKNFVKKLLALDNVYQVNAYYKQTPVATAILLHHGDRLIYFLGASANEHRNLMAPYLLHFAIIKLAKRLDCKYYDFWGIAPPADKGSGKESCYHNYCWEATHPLTGVSRFKAGFGGQVVAYPEACEIVLKPITYKIYSWFKKIRKQNNIVGHPLK